MYFIIKIGEKLEKKKQLMSYRSLLWGLFHQARCLHIGGFNDTVLAVSSLVGGVFVLIASVVIVLAQQMVG